MILAPFEIINAWLNSLLTEHPDLQINDQLLSLDTLCTAQPYKGTGSRVQYFDWWKKNCKGEGLLVLNSKYICTYDSCFVSELWCKSRKRRMVSFEKGNVMKGTKKNNLRKWTFLNNGSKKIFNYMTSINATAVCGIINI